MKKIRVNPSHSRHPRAIKAVSRQNTEFRRQLAVGSRRSEIRK
jgi:hypothetical protein